MRHWLIFTFLTALILFAVACDEPTAGSPGPAATPLPVAETAVSSRANRLLGIDVSEATGEEYDTAFQLARAAGMDVVELTVFWDEIETAPGVYEPDPNWLAIANEYYGAQGVQVAFTISVLDTTTVRVPPDLEGRAFDDAEVIARFQALLDFAATQIPDLPLVAISIGNEIDGVLGGDPAAWAQYEAFFRETAVHARTLWPGTPVGSKVMYPGLTGSALAFARSLNEHSDAVFVTYYPLQGDFTVREATAVAGHFDTLTEIYPEREIYVLEAGYPSGSRNNSSEAQQAAFVQQVFRAWDAHAGQMPLLIFNWLTDAPDDAVQEFSRYYGAADKRFVSFLATLGLRHADGTPKAAWAQLQAETAARGWGAP